jgi:hypothetical protein
VPDTIERHQQVASQQGSVWWGRLTYSSDVTGLSTEWLEALRAQLAAKRPTYVFLHSSPGGTWRARLLGITTDRSQVDAELVPSYYEPSAHYSLWVRLTRFEKSDPSQLTEGYVLARSGEPVTSKGLNNQTHLIVRRRDETNS